MIGTIGTAREDRVCRKTGVERGEKGQKIQRTNADGPMLTIDI